MSKGNKKNTSKKEVVSEAVNEVEELQVEEAGSNDDIQAELEKSDQDIEVSEEDDKGDDEKTVSEPEVDDYRDKYIRLAAEFDNYRRRTLNEKINLTKTAGENVLIKILPIIDDFERAMGSMKESKDCDGINSGIELIYGKFKEFLTQQGIKEINALNKEFDTDLHEALTKIPAPKKKLKDKVIDVIEKGYTLNDKVIRFSKVVIGE